MREFTEYPPLSLYVHFPWCVRKCPYCDFNSHNAPATIPEETYINALISDLEQHAPDIWGRPVESIFFGGGTPSLMTDGGFDRLLSKIRALVRLEPDAEITLEANPGTLDQQRFSAYRQAGANRLSIGVQSFNDNALKALGRIHGRAEAVDACRTALQCGFNNFNIDLMHGLPGQTPEQAADDVTEAIALNPGHISYYQLTLEPNTLFAARPPVLPHEDTLWEIQRDGQSLLARAGFEQYEVSAYARKNKQCKHNLNYWRFGDYLGIGAGAHSKLTFPAYARITRIAKHRHPATYMENVHGEGRIQQRNDIDRDETHFEFLMNALRLNRGFNWSEFQQCTGESVIAIIDKLRAAEDRGLIIMESEVVRPSEKGLQYLDTTLEHFMPQAQAGNKPQQRVIPITSDKARP
jgi:oxygen-independent coproporphyrinogen-3 oxidase